LLLLCDDSLIAKFPFAFPSVASVARRYQIQKFIRATRRNGIYMINLKKDVWSRSAAILTGKTVALEYLKSRFLAEGFSLSHLSIG
tara:strand:+ start:84622 stop:84879 length:258 start_codon:yes stop_codon:yes gene_type:complete